MYRCCCTRLWMTCSFQTNSHWSSAFSPLNSEVIEVIDPNRVQRQCNTSEVHKGPWKQNGDRFRWDSQYFYALTPQNDLNMRKMTISANNSVMTQSQKTTPHSHLGATLNPVLSTVIHFIQFPFFVAYYNVVQWNDIPTICHFTVHYVVYMHGIVCIIKNQLLTMINTITAWNPLYCCLKKDFTWV